MQTPADDGGLASRIPATTFNGYIRSPNENVTIEIRSTASNSWVEFASATSAPTGWTDVDGVTWYAWSVDARPPRTAQYWPSPGGEAQFRAVNSSGQVLYVGSDALWSCVFAAIGAGSGATAAYQGCYSSGSAQSAEVDAPCDVTVSGGCFDTVDVTVTSDWPSDLGSSFAEEIQGVTSDDNFWYFSNADVNGSIGGNLARASIGTNLNHIVAAVSGPFPGYLHPGDMDVADGWLFVALEEQGGSAPTNALGAIPTATFTDRSTYLTFPVVGVQSNGGVFPWVAHDPVSEYLYSSVFANTDRLLRYDIERSSSGVPTAFTPCGEVLLDQTLDRVQGGDFSDSGRLYLSTDPRSSAEIAAGAVYVVEMNGHLEGPIDCASPPLTYAQVVQRIFVEKQPPGPGGDEEIEGITIRDTDDGTLWGGTHRGQIHTLLLDNVWVGGDDFYFKHNRVSSLDDL